MKFKLKEAIQGTTLVITIGSIEKGKELSKIANKFSEDIDILSGRYIIDAKSILGIFSLNLWKPVEIILHSNSEETIAKFIEELKDFIVEEK